MKKIDVEVPRVALTIPEAAASLGIGVDFFNANVRGELRLIRKQSKVLVPVRELQRWAEQNAERVL